ncbi:ester cyclase [Stutzerimonas stutzeri]|uniref:Ester cyclase n=1 Tax=Stutzerimonas stutzeri TaxID=316 RepID=A0A2S4AKL7_STUST|nr:ester cyclase [Stutzerimonas stutzeri]MCQ4263536.1 ester cyclase [Stutzerimonas stutzeri]POH81782.1 ester cyclase [Stutzerimonas stutzeri]
MTPPELSGIYRAYIDCLNARDWSNLGRFVHDEVRHNGSRIGLAGYRRMLENDYATIPDLHFNIELLISEPPRVACRLRFNCSPAARFLDLDVDGRKVSFAENVFYEFSGPKIVEVHSVIDKPAIETQLSTPVDPNGR